MVWNAKRFKLKMLWDQAHQAAGDRFFLAVYPPPKGAAPRKPQIPHRSPQIKAGMSGRSCGVSMQYFMKYFQLIMKTSETLGLIRHMSRL